MAENQDEPIGSIGWVDLTVEDADGLRDFYKAVVGWESSDVDMKGYADYCMSPSVESAPVAGICHARGMNAGLPTAWIVYIRVANLSESLERCQAMGGHVLAGPRAMGPEARFAVIRDPAGATCALIGPG